MTATRLLEAIAAGAVTIITLGVAFGGGMPLAIGLVRWYDSQRNTNQSTRMGHSEMDTALAALRDRYARGGLTDEEFEARVEHPIETESVADAGSSPEREAEISEDNESTPESELAANTAEEDR